MERKNNDINYSIGLDIGTNSVGWAVVNDNYQLLKKGNKNLWGSRLFDSANTAASTRMNRSTRRRYNRRRKRILLLQEIMNDMIMSVDNTFFIRLKNTTFLDEEDKQSVLNDNYKDNYNLFIDKDFNDKDFYDKFPTIYHLRNYLIESKEKEDPRFIYLALHHIVKYRGNFLYENQEFSLDVENISEQFDELIMQFLNYNEIDTNIDLNIQDNLISILKEKKSRRLKLDECMELINFDKENKNQFQEFFKALTGQKFNLKKMLSDSELTVDDKDISLNFSSEKYDEEFEEYESFIEEYHQFIDNLKSIYGWIELQGILNNTNKSKISLSKAMIDRYDKHHNDLILLKSIIKKYIPEQYNEIFRKQDDKIHNYVHYIHNTSNTKRDDFYKYLTKILEQCPQESKDVKYCLDEINKENFLLKQNDVSNSNIPYQLNEDELIKIIQNQSQYYSDLKENADHIRRILTFRIPYYVGPLNNESRFAWVVRREEYKNEQIKPWNLEEIIDTDKTAENFIRRMTNFCTYLPGEAVMPKNSLTANMYEVLSELNKIRVDGKYLCTSVKKDIIKELFMKKKKVTDKSLRDWFKKNLIYLNNDNLEITGYQKEKAFSSSLSSWIDFSKLFDDVESYYDLIENIINDMTIFEDKSILKKRLKNRYNLSSKDVKYLMKKRYKGWSRLSRKLIDGLCTDNRYGSNCTILDVMKESNMTLMEIINNDELGYKKLIEERSFQNKDEKFKYDEVNELAGSPAIKRGIWQSLKIVEEITKYMKHKPTHIYIEFAREEGEKKRTSSQIKVLKNIYDNLSKEKKLAEEHDEKVYQYLKKEDVLSHISNERLYLYYTQMGKCMYSQKELDIDKLHLYEVDHIVPRSLIKDDSIDNKVLVIKDENQRKSNDPSLSSRIIDKQSSFWKFLLDNKLITPKKYFNLMRREYDEKTTEKFINRQIVETRQIIKNVAQIISEHYSTTKVVTVRANLTHQFREKYHIYKNRNVNDYHHAHDAYIACIIGDYIQKCYPKLESKYIYGEYLIVYKKDKKKQFNDGFILNGMRNDRFDLDTGERVWDASQIPNIIKCFDYKDCFITKKLEDNDSALFKVTIVPGNKNSNKGKTEASIPVNKYRSNIEKYGGYTGIEYEILAIEGMKKKKKIRKLVGLPLAYRSYSKDEQVKYIENNEKLTNVKIIKTIKKNQLIEYNGGLFFITSYQELVNAKQLILSHHDMGTIYMINKAITSNDYSSLNQSDVVSVYEIWLNKLEKLYPLYNSIVDLLKSLKDNFEKLTLEQQCAIIMELLKITQANPASNNKIKFDKFTMPERKSRLNGKTINLDGITFINQSVTGIYEKKVKL